MQRCRTRRSLDAQHAAQNNAKAARLEAGRRRARRVSSPRVLSSFQDPFLQHTNSITHTYIVYNKIIIHCSQLETGHSCKHVVIWPDLAPFFGWPGVRGWASAVIT